MQWIVQCPIDGEASSYSPLDNNNAEPKSSAVLSSEEGSSKYDLSGGIDDGRANGSEQSQQYNYRAGEEKIGLDAVSVGRIVGEEGEAVEDDGDSNIRGRADGREEGVTRFCLVGGSEHVNVGDEVEGKEFLGGLVRGEGGLIRRGEGVGDEVEGKESLGGLVRGEGGLIRRGEGGLVRGGEGGTNLLLPSHF